MHTMFAMLLNDYLVPVAAVHLQKIPKSGETCEGWAGHRAERTEYCLDQEAEEKQDNEASSSSQYEGMGRECTQKYSKLHSFLSIG